MSRSLSQPKTGSRRRCLPLQLIVGAALLIANEGAFGGGEEEFAAGFELHQKGDAVGALAKWRDAAAKGHPDAMYNIGVCYVEGRGVEQDYEVALRWFRKAAAKGQPDAMYNVGIFRVCYWIHGVTNN